MHVTCQFNSAFDMRHYLISLTTLENSDVHRLWYIDAKDVGMNFQEIMESLISFWWSVNQFIDIPHCLNCMNIFPKNAQGVTISLYHPVCNQKIFGVLQFPISKIFWSKTTKNICSPLYNAAFGTFWVQIGQFFESKWVWEDSRNFLFSIGFASKTSK